MESSIPGLIGAAIGLAIGLVDYRVVSGVMRATREKRRAAQEYVRLGDKEFELMLKLIFLITVVGFPIAGYFFGRTLGG